ncbi:hypothetical protein ACFLYU_03485 [Candidatus Dependentiae bacterium]
MKKSFYLILFLSIIIFHCNTHAMKRPRKSKKIITRSYSGKMEDKNKLKKKIRIEFVEKNDIIIGFFIPRMLEIQKYSKKIKGKKSILSRYAKQIKPENLSKIFCDVDETYKKRCMLKIKDIVNTKNLEKYTYSQFHDKESLLEVWKNLQKLKIFVLRNEITSRSNKRFNKLEAYRIEAMYLGKCAEYYKKNYSQYQVYNLVSNLDKNIKMELNSIKEKEKLFNQHKKLCVIIDRVCKFIKD